MSDDVQAKVKNRNNWLLVVVVSVLTIVLSWKIVLTDFGPAVQQFDFTDLLALFLALFAIALSAAFYFKASDSAANFYDNTYKFTRDTSEILGRIEAGFGERLRHLDEGYSGLATRFDRLPSLAQEIESAEQEIQHEDERLSRQLKERQQLIDKLMERAKLRDEEREEFHLALRDRDEHITSLRGELAAMRAHLQRVEGEAEAVRGRIPVPGGLRLFVRHLLSTAVGDAIAHGAPAPIIKREFKRNIEHIRGPGLEVMEIEGWVDEKHELTPKGVAALKMLAAELRPPAS
jgi:hypothetical protein